MTTSAPGRVLAVSLSPKHSFSKQPQPSITLIAGEGVQGDAHRGVTVRHQYYVRRDPSRPNLCQVHLFASEMLDELAAQGFPLLPGEIGENILTHGIDLLALPQQTRLHLGAMAVVEITGLRTPCSQIDAHRPGLQDRVWGKRDATGTRARRAGVMSIVRQGGAVGPHDTVRVELPPEPHLPLAPV